MTLSGIQADTESQETVDFTPKQEPVQQVESLENEKNVAGQTKHNFHYNLWEMEKGGAKTRYQWNMDAIRTLKQIESENRLATPEEQKTLSKFVGWGGLSQAFDENNAGWSKEYAELKDLLSDEEYSAARATVNNAFYTSPEIAMCINSALVQFGFRGGNVLEPSMGIGNFFGSMPAPMQRSKLYDAKTDAQRDALFKEMRTGKKKVLIGSTDKCGTGVNVQTHLVAMHHVDCPWKPSSIEQREGRGIRQGKAKKLRILSS